MTTERRSARGGPRRGLRREEAAAYIGIGATKFDEWVERGIMPKPKRQDGVVVWDLVRLDSAFEALPDDGGEAKGGSAWD
jgi:predicted DNA-binding transcriptional regulator AlpA